MKNLICICVMWKGQSYVNANVSVSSIFKNGQFFLKYHFLCHRRFPHKRFRDSGLLRMPFWKYIQALRTLFIIDALEITRNPLLMKNSQSMYYAHLTSVGFEHSVCRESLLTSFIMLLAWLVEHSLIHWYQQCVTVHHVLKCNCLPFWHICIYICVCVCIYSLSSISYKY